MIICFLKLYQKRELCSELLKSFKKICQDPKENEKNMDRKSILKEYTSIFKTINSEANKIIEIYNYDPIELYGIILSYMNFYDYESFSLTVNELYKKRPDDLFEILLIFNSHLKNPIRQDFDFLNDFIKYSITKKDFANLQKGLNYIKDICTFLNIIDKNKEDIHNTFNLKKIEKIIKIDDLKFKKTEKDDNEAQEGQEAATKEQKFSSKKHKQNEEETNSNSNKKNESNFKKTLKNIKSIITFCREKDTFLIYFPNTFWSYIINYYNEQNNIDISFQISVLFKKYYDLVDKIYKMLDTKDKMKMATIKKEVFSYNDRDESAHILAQMNTKFNNKSEVTDNENKRAFIERYNPYYREHKYSNKVDYFIFDSIDLNQIYKKFIED